MNDIILFKKNFMEKLPNYLKRKAQNKTKKTVEDPKTIKNWKYHKGGREDSFMGKMYMKLRFLWSVNSTFNDSSKTSIIIWIVHISLSKANNLTTIAIYQWKWETKAKQNQQVDVFYKIQKNCINLTLKCGQ